MKIDCLRQLQLTQLSILKDIDVFCREHGIRYSLYAGTLLGAVRHKGFIPWDDDLDICMERNEYDRFISLWQEKKPAGYVMENKENAPAFPQSFTKISKDHTTFLQSADVIGGYHLGIFVDVFPIDRMPAGGWARRAFKLRVMLYLLFTREFVPPKAGWMTKAGCAALLALVPAGKRQATRAKLLQGITQYNSDRSLPGVAIETMGSLRSLFPADMLDEFVMLPFEDAEFMCFAKWDEKLRSMYSNYMEFPPESERAWKHQPKIIDFERNYDELPH